MARAIDVNNVSGLKSGNNFVAYASPQDSIDATTADIANKQKGKTSTGLNANSTLEQFVNTWINGPKYANTRLPNQGYTADNVAKELGVNPQTKIGSLDPKQLTLAVAKFETNYGGQTSGASTSTNGNQMDYHAFATAVKQKYPAYANQDDLTLTKAILAKYPQYASRVNLGGSSSISTDNSPKPDANGYITTPAPETPGAGAANANTNEWLNTIVSGGQDPVAKSITAGLLAHSSDYKGAEASQAKADALMLQLIKQIGNNKKAGKDTSRLEAMLNTLQTEAGGDKSEGGRNDFTNLNPAKNVSTAQALTGVGLMGAPMLASGTYGAAADVMDTGKLAPVAKEFAPSLYTKVAQPLLKTAMKHKVASALITDALANRLPEGVKKTINKTVPLLKYLIGE